jgi:hypothetical protein
MAGFSTNQKKFIATYARETGLNPGVVAAQVAAEEPVGANAGWHGLTGNWLNIGITDSGPMGAGNPAWHDPVAGAKLSAAWTTGKISLPGFGRASGGIQAVARTRGQSPQAQIAALQRSGWASSGYPSLPSLYRTYGGTNPALPAGGGAGGGVPGTKPGGGGFTAKTSNVNLPITTTVPQVDQQAFQQAQKAAIAGQFLAQQASSSPWKGLPGIAPIKPYAGLPTTMPSQADYTTLAQKTTNYKLAQTTLQKLAGGTNLNTHPGSLPSGQGDVNPLAHGWNIGRTDQGVDASARPGTPILAINDSVVKEIVPGWYNGQPLVLLQLTSGPNRGKYWFIAEQITGLPRVGQRLARGQTVARYASSGTGIEVGWGSPKSSGRTLAQATTGYSEGQQTPAGIDFRRRVLHR